MGVASIADTSGIVVSAFVSILAHNQICKMGVTWWHRCVYSQAYVVLQNSHKLHKGLFCETLRSSSFLKKIICAVFMQALVCNYYFYFFMVPVRSYPIHNEIVNSVNAYWIYFSTVFISINYTKIVNTLAACICKLHGSRSKRYYVYNTEKISYLP